MFKLKNLIFPFLLVICLSFTNNCLLGQFTGYGNDQNYQSAFRLPIINDLPPIMSDMSDLTLSSYSTNKNDMVSKIISPIEKLVKNEKNIDFKITCNWTMSNFTMKLEDTELEIFMIKSL